MCDCVSVCERERSCRCDTISQCLSPYLQSASTSCVLPRISASHADVRRLLKWTHRQFPRKWKATLLQWLDLNKMWWRLPPAHQQAASCVVTYVWFKPSARSPCISLRDSEVKSTTRVIERVSSTWHAFLFLGLNRPCWLIL